MAIVVGQTLWQASIGPECNFLKILCPTLGTSMPLGGTIICKNELGTAWIVAPNTSEVSRSWYCRDDAVTTATNCTSATGWFVPTCGQLQCPGFRCRTFWDSFSSTDDYWSSTEYNSVRAWLVYLAYGDAINTSKELTCCVRAFRCVTY